MRFRAAGSRDQVIGPPQVLAPRLHKRSIDFTRFHEEHGDDPPVPFSFLTSPINRPQIACHVVYTTERVHALVREHIAHTVLKADIEAINAFASALE